MNTQSLTYETLFGNKPSNDHTVLNTSEQGQSSFQAINQQLQHLLTKINSNNEDTPAPNMQVLPVDNPDDKLNSLTNAIEELKTYITHKFNNFEKNLNSAKDEIHNLRTNQRTEFIHLNDNINKQMQLILSSFEQNATSALNKQIAATNPKNWEEALCSLEQADPLADSYSGLDDAAMQRILQRSQTYKNLQF